MSERKRKGILVAALIWVVILGGLAAAYRLFIHPHFQDELASDTGSESQYKSKVTVAADAFSGYAVLRSDAMKAQLRTDGIKLVVEDDQADYVGRMKALRKGDVDMAVFTVDALITAGVAIDDFPATIVMVIDETIGADAIVGFDSHLPNLQALDSADARIVATPSSPSEFLARTVIATLSLPSLPEDWLVEADGAGDAFKKLKAAGDKEKKYAYVLWEPFVSKALKETGVKVLLDSSKMKGYIVDVLVAQRAFLKEHPQVVRKVVEAYLRAAYSYEQKPDGMVNLVMADAKAGGEPLSKEEAQKLVDGIRWKNTVENYAHFGIASAPGIDILEDVIQKIADVLVRTDAIKENPVRDKAHTLFYKGTLVELESEGFHPGKKVAILEGVGPDTDDLAQARVAKELVPLAEEEWKKLATVGTMRVEAITFRRGTSKISELSESELNALARKLGSWPNYYMRIVGHARPEGDAKANEKLARQRAEATRKYLVKRGVKEHRLRAEVALGSSAESSTSFVLGQKPY